MAKVREDLIEGHSAQEDENGYSAVRVYYMDEVSGNGPRKVMNALKDPKIPQRGDLYPGTEEMAVVDRQAAPYDASPKQMKVIINYKLISDSEDDTPSDNQECILEISSSVQSVQTQFDYTGKQQLQVHYTFPEDAKDSETGGPDDRADGKPIKQVGTIEKQIPLTIRRYSRKESSDPSAKANLYPGKINSKPIFGDPAKYWLCMGIPSRTSDRGQSWDVIYIFQRNESAKDGWDTNITWLDPRTGKFIEIPKEEIGKVTEPFEIARFKTSRSIQVYETIDFNELNLNFRGESGAGTGVNFGISGSTLLGI